MMRFMFDGKEIVSISQLIEQLQLIKHSYGDMPVWVDERISDWPLYKQDVHVSKDTDEYRDNQIVLWI